MSDPLLTDAEVALIRDLWEARVPATEIARRVGVTERDMRRLAREMSLPRRERTGLKHRTALDSDAARAELTRLWLADMPTADIADRLGVTPGIVRRHAKLLQLPPRPRRRGEGRPRRPARPRRPHRPDLA